MAGHGPPPADEDKRVRRNKTDTLKIAAGTRAANVPEMPPYTGAPDAETDEELDWLPETIDWWNTWAASEQASVMLPTDWQRLKMLLPLVDQYFSVPAKDLMSEIRLNEEKLGATLVDRRRLGMKVTAKAEDDGEDGTGGNKRRRSGRARPDPRRAALKVVNGDR